MNISPYWATSMANGGPLDTNTPRFLHARTDTCYDGCGEKGTSLQTMHSLSFVSLEDRDGVGQDRAGRYRSNSKPVRSA